MLNIIHHAKNVSIINTSVQLIWVWNHLNVSLHEDVCCSTDLITVSLFIENIENMKKVWFDKYNCCTESARQSSQQSQQQNQQHQQQDNAFNNYSFHLYSQFSGSWFSYQFYQQNNAYNCLYQLYQSYLSHSYVNVNVLSSLTSYHQPLQITSSNINYS